jgi:hypothetical protein
MTSKVEKGHPSIRITETPKSIFFSRDSDGAKILELIIIYRTAVVDIQIVVSVMI